MPSDAGDARRLHPASLLFSVGSAAWKLLLPGLLILLLSRGRDPEIWLMLLFVPAVLGAVAKYLSFRYRLADDELVIRAGILTRNERHVPYARIQNIDLSQNPLQRALGVADVTIETAGGHEPEARMQVLSLGAIAHLREHVYRGRNGALADKAREEPAGGETRHDLLRLGAADLTLMGLMSNRGLVVVLGLWGLIWQAGSRDWAPEWLRAFSDPGSIDPQRLEHLLGRPAQVQAPAWVIALLALAALAIVMVALRLLSIVWAFVQFWDFRLTRTGDDLGTSYGLVTRRTATVPRHRVQLLTIRESMLHRWFGRVEVKVQTAGGVQDKEAVSARRAIAPLVARERLSGLLGEIQPGLDLEALEWQRVEPRAWRRVLTKTLVGGLLLTALGGLVVGRWSWLAGLALLPLAVVLVRLRFQRLGYAFGEQLVAYRSGWWVRRLSVVRFAKIQVVDLSQNPFDRRHRMASLRVDTAGAGRTGHRLRIPYLAVATAGDLQSRLALEAARTEFRW